MAMLNRKITPKNDLLFRRLFASLGNEHILKGFIQDVLKIKIKKVMPVNPYNIGEFKDRKRAQTIVDVKAITDEGEHIIIEMQVIHHKYFLERTQMYVYQSFTETYADKEYMKGNNKYSSIRNVYGIFIMDFSIDESCNDAVRRFVPKDENNVPLKSLGTKSVEMVYFNLNGETEDAVLKDWINFFHGKEVPEDAPEYILEAEEKTNYENLTEGEREMVRAVEMERDLYEAIISDSKEEGIEKGRVETTIELVLSMHDNGLTSEMISRIVKTSVENVEKIIETYK